jgi:hypothetical protein
VFTAGLALIQSSIRDDSVLGHRQSDVKKQVKTILTAKIKVANGDESSRPLKHG